MRCWFQKTPAVPQQVQMIDSVRPASVGLRTRKEVHEFFAQREVDTGGAINQHIITIEDVDDGDVWCRVAIPLWGNNDRVIRDVVRLLAEILEFCPGSAMYADDNAISVCIYEHACDPD